MKKIAPPEEIRQKFILDLEAIKYFEAKYKREDQEAKKAIKKKLRDEAKKAIKKPEDDAVKTVREMTFPPEVLPPSSSPTQSQCDFRYSLSSDGASDSYYTADEYPATSSNASIAIPSPSDSPHLSTQGFRVTKERAPGEPTSSRRKGPRPSIPYTSLEDYGDFTSNSGAVMVEDIPRNLANDADFEFPDTISSPVRLESECVKLGRTIKLTRIDSAERSRQFDGHTRATPQ